MTEYLLASGQKNDLREGDIVSIRCRVKYDGRGEEEVFLTVEDRLHMTEFRVPASTCTLVQRIWHVGEVVTFDPGSKVMSRRGMLLFGPLHSMEIVYVSPVTVVGRLIKPEIDGLVYVGDIVLADPRNIELVKEIEQEPSPAPEVVSELSEVAQS